LPPPDRGACVSGIWTLNPTIPNPEAVAGYIYSGPTAAHTYSSVFEDGEPDVFIILGPNHHGVGAETAVWRNGGWKTPFGVVKVDEKVADALIGQSPDFKADERAHKQEHSIEVQLPFLQFLFPNTKIVPIRIISELGSQNRISELWEKSNEIGRTIANTLDSLDIDGLVIASSDFTHFESASSAFSKDHAAIDKIIKLDDEGFVQTVYTHYATICGYAPIITSIAFAKERGATIGKLLKYTTSGDISGDNGHVVAYGSIIFQ